MSSNLIAHTQEESPSTATQLLAALRSVRNIGFVYSLERYLPETGILQQVEASSVQLNRFGYKEEATVLKHVLSLQALPVESGGLGLDEAARLDVTQEAQVLDLVVKWLESLNTGKAPTSSQTLPLRHKDLISA
ncbi:hypothetical protein PVAG01_06775 [Phlyctema vagabunda]|uniref:Uncharacterized protein n=1 Tax=Phlyctema vagabunda TaxID=108571 RepID=A0ABR4PH35_9HELO